MVISDLENEEGLWVGALMLNVAITARLVAAKSVRAHRIIIRLFSRLLRFVK
jgi:hypothetical protein